MGVTTIGDRLRLRDLCAVAEKDRTRESVASNVLQERMALFNGRNSRRADRKKKSVAKRSWTVSFVCVADRHQSKIPTSTEKQVLFQAGLLRTIFFGDGTKITETKAISNRCYAYMTKFFVR